MPPRPDRPVLLVEDDEDIRQLLGMLLEGEGYRVEAARHGREALEMLQRHSEPPGLIFLDLMMPVMDGHEFLAALPETVPAARDVPVYVLTAAHDPVASPVAGRLSKPVDIERILTLAERYCGPAAAP